MHRLFSFLFLTLASSVALSAEPNVIKEIEIRGAHRVETAAVRSKLSSKIGAPLSRETVKDDIRAIFGLKLFDSIEVSEESAPGGVRLVFDVKESPLISKVELEGVSAIEGDDLKEVVQVKDRDVLDIHKLNQTVEKFIAKYEEKGYFLADVKYQVIPQEKNEVLVKIKVIENDKIQVKSIEIVGNAVLSDEELKGIMQTREGGPFSWLTGSGGYREGAFERDVSNLGVFYGMHGYVRARFAKPQVSVSADKRWVYITFFVEEGPQFKVGKVDFAGDLLYTRQELLDDLKLESGEPFNTEVLRRETLKYTEKYGDLGYAFANVVPRPDIHDDTKTVDITFDVERGERVYIGKITVTGNSKSKDKVLRRELRIYEGELYSGTRKRESRDNIVRLGFYDNVDFHQSASRVDPQLMDIEIRVKERSTGQLVIGAGYASGNIGFTAQAQLSQNNFLGNGQVASFSATVLTGRNFYEFNFSFMDPYVGYSNWSLGGDLYQLRRSLFGSQSVVTFDETKTGFSFKTGHPVLEFTNFYLTYKLENSYVPESSIIDTALISKSSVNGITSSVTASVLYDKRDDRFDPRNGWYWNLAGEFAGLGGNRQFVKSKAEIKFFHPIVWDLVFRANMRGANIAPWGNSTVPINELFIHGGLYSLRGYPNLSIGPHETLSAPGSPTLSPAAQAANLGGTNIVVGGHNEVLLNAEIEFPVLKEAKIRGVIFFDTGNAFDGTIFEQSPMLYANVGWGIRWFTPIGPLRFEFGYPIVNATAPQFYFTIGPPF